MQEECNRLGDYIVREVDVCNVDLRTIKLQGVSVAKFYQDGLESVARKPFLE